jgi:hypothetical protein
MARPKGTVTACEHTDREHAARGLCGPCYAVSRRKGYWGDGPRARCHVERPHYANGLCRGCYDAQRFQTRGVRLTDEQLAIRAEQARSATRDWQLRKTGITQERYDAMLAAQGGVCAICGKPERYKARGSTRRLAVDHDHACCPGTRSCGRCIRGLLCNFCNRLLGMAEDDPTVLASAITYLARDY